MSSAMKNWKLHQNDENVQNVQNERKPREWKRCGDVNES